jgi:hypothetical protein
MPQPKPKPAPDADPSSLLDLLAKGLLLTSDRIQAAMDDAVRRGRMTRHDAEELMQSLVEAGRRQTEELLHDLEALVGRSLGDRARRAVGLGSSPPIAGYDELTAAEVVRRLGGLTPDELRRVREHERRHANRKTVLRAVEQRLA